LGTVVQTLKLPDGAVKVLIEGKKRAQVARFVNNPDFFLVEVEEVSEVVERNAKVEALTREVSSTFKNYVKLKKKIPPKTVKSISAIDDPARLSDNIVAHLGIKLGDRQNLLETFNATERLEMVLAHMRADAVGESRPEMQAVSPESLIKPVIDRETSVVDKLGTFDWQEYLDTHSNSIHGSSTAKAGSLEDHLLWQLRLSKITEPETSIGRYIIQNLDKNGYLALTIDEVCAATKSTPAAVEAVLKRIQFFDPVGVAARDLRECLLVQLENLQLRDSLAAVIVRNHLSLLESKRYERLAKDLNVSIEKIANAAHLIGSLEAKPSRGFEQDE